MGISPDSLAVADYNGDGLLDLAAANANSNNVTVLSGVGTTAQTITFGPLSGVIIGAAPFMLTATASSGLTVTFASTTTGVCTVSRDYGHDRWRRYLLDHRQPGGKRYLRQRNARNAKFHCLSTAASPSPAAPCTGHDPVFRKLRDCSRLRHLDKLHGERRQAAFYLVGE